MVWQSVSSIKLKTRISEIIFQPNYTDMMLLKSKTQQNNNLSCMRSSRMLSLKLSLGERSWQTQIFMPWFIIKIHEVSQFLSSTSIPKLDNGNVVQIVHLHKLPIIKSFPFKLVVDWRHIFILLHFLTLIVARKMLKTLSAGSEAAGTLDQAIITMKSDSLGPFLQRIIAPIHHFFFVSNDLLQKKW